MTYTERLAALQRDASLHEAMELLRKVVPMAERGDWLLNRIVVREEEMLSGGYCRCIVPAFGRTVIGIPCTPVDSKKRQNVEREIDAAIHRERSND